MALALLDKKQALYHLTFKPGPDHKPQIVNQAGHCDNSCLQMGGADCLLMRSISFLLFLLYIMMLELKGILLQLISSGISIVKKCMFIC